MQTTGITVEDREAIREVLARYLWCSDTGDLEGLVATFTDDGIVVDRSGKVWGPELGGARGFATQVMGWNGRKPGARGDQHWVQHLYMEDSEDGAVRVISYWMSAASSETEQAFIRVLGTYVDTCVRVGGDWLIKEKLIQNWDRDFVAPR